MRICTRPTYSFLSRAWSGWAKDANRCHLTNANTPEEPSLSEIDQADMKSFLGQLLLVLNVVGIGIFQHPTAATFATTIYYTDAKGLHAEGDETDDGFVVRAGSQSPSEEVPTCPTAIRAACAELRQQKIFKQQGDMLVLTRDYLFSSPSQAAAVMLARSANGRIEWKTKDGLCGTRLPTVRTVNLCSKAEDACILRERSQPPTRLQTACRRTP